MLYHFRTSANFIQFMVFHFDVCLFLCVLVDMFSFLFSLVSPPLLFFLSSIGPLLHPSILFSNLHISLSLTSVTPRLY